MSELKLGVHGDALWLDVHVVPRAAKSACVGEHDGRAKIALAAQPVDGAANAELVRFVAELAGVPKRDVTLVRGEKSRQKTVAIRGVSEAALRARLNTA